MNELPVLPRSRVPKIVVVVTIVALAGLGAYHFQGSNAQVQRDTCGVYPQAMLLHGVESAILGSASLLSTSDNGSSVGPPFTNAGTPTVHTDYNHTKISLYQLAAGASGPGIAATITNTGSLTLNLTDFRIFGMMGPIGSTAWTSVLQAGAIDTRPNPNMFGICPGPEPPLTTPTLFSPGQSLTMDIKGTWSYQSHPINGFQADVTYWIPGDALQTLSETNLVWVK